MNNSIQEHFQLHDPILARLMLQVGPLSIPPEKNFDTLLAELCETIVGQQLSVKAASTIWSRVAPLCKDWNRANSILEIDDETLRNSGVSYQKISYIKNAARAWLDGTVNVESLSSMDDSQVVETLIKIKGVGNWTAEMLLIFSLGRKDVFSMGDKGLKNAITNIYGNLEDSQLQVLIDTWKPYRSYAALALWKSLDNEPKMN